VKTVLLMTAVLSFSAFAKQPKVGIQAKYFISEFDGSTRYTRFTLKKIDREDTVQVEDFDGSEPYEIQMTPEEVYKPRVLKDCKANYGTLETITVKAGTFKACKFVEVQDDGTLEKWEALVPFVTVKAHWTWPDGGSTIWELVEKK
jgi:hypothetical protein